MGLRSADNDDYRVDTDPRRDVARLVTAHPVTHDENPLTDQNAVLVPRPPPTDVGAATVLDHLEKPSRTLIAARSGSRQAKRDARDLGNPDLLPGPQRPVQRKAIRLGDDFAANLVAVVQLGQRTAQFPRPDHVA